jgi:hypothetical protein
MEVRHLYFYFGAEAASARSAVDAATATGLHPIFLLNKQNNHKQ